MVCIIAVWILSGCAVLPHAVYTRYLDFGNTSLGPEFKGTGICWVTIQNNSEKYIRVLFVILFCLPLGITASLFIKVSMELENLSASTSSIKIDSGSRYSEASYQSHVTWLSSENVVKIGSESNGNSIAHSADGSVEECDDDNLDIRKEKRAQRYLAAMVTSFAICWLPVYILTMVTHFVQDDDDHMKNYDITYITFTFIGFLSTCIKPLLFVCWCMSSASRKQLCAQLKLGKRGTTTTSANPLMSSEKTDKKYHGIHSDTKLVLDK